ncbi:MAG TPA: hypothetical protein ENO31_02215 [Thermoprotei archaeon]|nr:hypothetical protein [Thermoprotei archaeon]
MPVTYSVEGERLLIIRNPYSEFSFWTAFEEFQQGLWRPKLHYSYEGYTSMYNGRSWKLLAGLAFSPGGSLRSAEFDRLSASLSFDGGYLRLEMTTASPDLKVEGAVEKIVPIIELRDVYGDEVKPITRRTDEGVLVEAGPAKFLVKHNGKFEPLDQELSVVYDRGSGFRTGKPPSPVKESKRAHVLFGLSFQDNAELVVHPLFSFVRPKISQWDLDLVEAFPEFRVTPWGRLLIGRAESAALFGVGCGSASLPDAGAWWFRQVWSRDLYQGLLFNLRAFHRIPWLREGLWLAAETGFAAMGYDGGIPDRLCPLEGSSASDALPLFLMYVSSLLSLDWREAYACALSSVADYALACLPALSKLSTTGMIESNAASSWWDSRVWVNGHLRATRLPEGWEDRDYVLPEVNALYAVAFSEVAQVAEKLGNDGGKLREASSTIVKSMAKLSKGYLPMIYDALEGRADYTPSSTAIMAHALLSRLGAFKEDALLDGVVNKLMVKKRIVGIEGYAGQWLPFGVLVRPFPGPYLGDAEYHGAVVWPRETPYLLEVLSELGKSDVMKDILISNLDATASDGALLYVPELYSLDGDELVPVKNPAQFWSNWVDPYLTYLDVMRG